MRIDHFLAHLETHRLSRREPLGHAVGVGAAGTLAGVGLRLDAATGAESRSRVGSDERFDDEMFDVEAVLAGAWDNTRFYRRGDQRGTFQEVTPAKTSRALRILDQRRPVRTYNLGDLLFNGYPAYDTTPARTYNQRLTVLGYQPPSGFAGVLQSTAPLGPNRVSVHEERFRETQRSAPYAGTYQIGTQLDNLGHVGVGPVFYGGHRGPEIAATWGTRRLGNEHMGPIVTRGVLLDVLGLKLEQGDTGVIETAGNGEPHLAGGYRITLEDLRPRCAAAGSGVSRLATSSSSARAGTSSSNPKDPEGHQPDDGTHPGHPDHVKYLASEPGIYLREARWLAEHRPAIIGADTWALEVVANPVSENNAFPVHQELLAHYGVRIGEGIVTDRLARDRVSEFVYLCTPQYALGATARNAPPAALGQPA